MRLPAPTTQQDAPAAQEGFPSKAGIEPPGFAVLSEPSQWSKWNFISIIKVDPPIAQVTDSQEGSRLCQHWL